MRIRSLIFTAAFVSLTSFTAQAGIIALYPATTDGGYEQTCNFAEPTEPGIREVAIVLRSGDNSYSGVKRLVLLGPGFWWPESLTSPWDLTGSFEDFSVTFGSCQSPPVVIAIARYMKVSAYHGCDFMSLGAPWYLADALTRCDGTSEQAFEEYMLINGYIEDGHCYCNTIRAEQSTWGRVKALYRN